MTHRPTPGWRFHTGFALALILAAVGMALTDSTRWVATAHGIGALVFLVVGAWSIATTGDGPLRRGVVAGLLLLAASALSFVGVFLPSALPLRLTWSMALTAAISAIALEIVANRYEETLEQLHG